MALYEIYVFPYYKLFYFVRSLKKNDNTLYLYKESKRIIYKYKLCSLYIIYDQYFTSNNIELAEINNLLKKSDDYIHKDYPKSLIYAEQACAIAEKN
ncbi:hypothetical protein C7E23_14045 [Elizabethkingia anophelis]|nr:hypothetical protein C7E23_14045 [Elizabethkingia anophelis]